MSNPALLKGATMPWYFVLAIIGIVTCIIGTIVCLISNEVYAFGLSEFAGYTAVVGLVVCILSLAVAACVGMNADGVSHDHARKRADQRCAPYVTHIHEVESQNLMLYTCGTSHVQYQERW